VTQAGFVGYDEKGHFIHYCQCGAWGAFGYNASSLRAGKLGTWYCGEHRPEGALPVTVRLSPQWLARAIEVGKARNQFAEQQGYENYGELSGSTRDHHITGAIGECGVAKHFKLRWNPNVGVITGIDVGDKLEVRARRPSQTGGDLVIRPDDKDDRPYVLVWVNDDDSMVLKGWLFAKEAKGTGQWMQAMGIWFVPPPYRPISELAELLKP
jgi:hypothetical protein